MTASRIGLVFASLLLAGLFSAEAYAACPCVGDPSMNDGKGSCADPESNGPHGPNKCTSNPQGLVGTDGQGCIENPNPVAEEGDNCAACVGGAVRSFNDFDELVLAKGCACVINDDMMTWTCISTNGINVDNPGVPMVPPVPPIPTEEELQDRIDDLIFVETEVMGDGTVSDGMGGSMASECRIRAEMACTAVTPM